MPERTLFHLVFLCQVLMISWYLPRKISSTMRHVVSKYPPSEYPRLYPQPLAYYESARWTFRALNLLALLIGLALVFLGLYFPTDEMLGWDDNSVLTLYLLLQYLPFLTAVASGLVFFSSKRAPDSRPTRRAPLRRRRLFDFVPRAAVALAAFVYLAFVVFIVYVDQFDYSWFGGYWNIFGITAVNAVFAVIGLHALYGKRGDPYLSEPDRLRAIEITLKALFFVSIVATLNVVLAIVLQILDLGHVRSIASSLYFILMAVVVYQAFRIDHVDFDVYREEPQLT